jgi:hypothetical protein
LVTMERSAREGGTPGAPYVGAGTDAVGYAT